MAKKKHSENHAAVPSAPAAIASEAAGHDDDDLSAEPLGELAGEVRAFIDRREELAAKLVQEIAFTEKKLAELKRTLALLFPENATNGNADALQLERKPKKLGLSKTSKSPRDSAADESPSSQHSAPQTTTLHSATSHSHAPHHTPAEPSVAQASSSQASEGLGGMDAHGNPI
jgi:hypothetical protein